MPLLIFYALFDFLLTILLTLGKTFNVVGLQRTISGKVIPGYHPTLRGARGGAPPRPGGPPAGATGS